jgi:hypothetical protein
VDAWEELGRILGITHRGGSIIVGLVEWGISLPSIHQQCAPRCHRRLDKWNQRRRREVLDHSEPDAAGAPAAYFDRSDDDRLVAVALASAAALFLDTAHIGLIHFDNA